MTPKADHASFDLTYLRQDFRGGLVVFLVAVPLCLGIALASGAPLFSGIIAGIVGGLIVGSLSGSQLSVAGPAAGLTTIVLSSIEKLGQFDAFLLAVAIAGVIQIVLGLVKAGGISHFFPSAVIKGMLAAIGLTLILKQIPHALGYDEDAEGEFEFLQKDGENTLSEILRAFSNPNATAIVIAVVAAAIMLLWDRPAIKKNKVLGTLPGPLVVVVAGVLINELFRRLVPGMVLDGNHLVQLPKADEVGGVFNLITFPDFKQYANPQVYISAVTIAIVASLETLLNVEAADKLDPLKRNSPPNRELMAQGVGNLASGLIGGLPVTSVIVRSSVNIMSGSRTKMAAIIHGVLLLVCVLLIPGILNLIPLSALAAILILTGYKLAKFGLFQDMYKQGFTQFLPFIVTIIAILFTDLLIGIGIGLVVGIFFILRENYRSSHGGFQRESVGGGERIRINLSQHVSFLNKAGIAEMLDNLPENTTVEIDGTQSAYIDHDILETLENFRDTAKRRNIRLYFLRKEDASTVPVQQPEPEHRPDAQRSFAEYNRLFDNNRKWVQEKLQVDPDYFNNLAMGQSPKFLFIGCSDSRVPVSEITGTAPGEVFVHRNVANLVVSTDLNLLSVLQYAVEVLKVEHVIVCGHYGCGGVKASMHDKDLGLINKWLRNIKDVIRLHRNELNQIENEDQRFKRLVELNVVEQVYNLHKTSIIQKAYQREASIHVHGWVYDIREGLLKDMNVDVQRTFEEYGEIYRYHVPKDDKPKVEAVKKVAIAVPGDGQSDGKSDFPPSARR
jgi:carbonic anhydrase